MALTVRAGFHDVEEVRRDLDSLEVGLSKVVSVFARRRFGPVLAEVQGLMPFDSEHRGWRGHDASWHDPEDPGHIRASVTGRPLAGGFAIETSHPGGPVHWWGGAIRPRESVIEIHHLAGAGEDFVSKEAEDAGRRFDEDVERELRNRNF